MIVKSFYGNTVAGALKQVRSELGGDAIILKTRRLSATELATAPGRIEVTACVDKASSHKAALSGGTTDPLVKQPPVATTAFPSREIVRKLDFLIDVFQAPRRSRRYPGVVGRIFTQLVNGDIPEALACDIAERLLERFEPEDEFAAVAGIAREMLLDQLPAPAKTSLESNQRVVLVGPPGSGKTSLMGRLAGYLVGHQRQAVCMTSCDRVKVSAPEELQAYAELLDVDHFELSGATDKAALERMGRNKVMIIDTPGINANDKHEIEVYREKLQRMKPHRVIGVVSCLMRTVDLYEILTAYQALNLTDLAITMADQTARRGGIIALPIQTGVPVSIIGTGRKAGQLDLSPDFRGIAGSLLGLDDMVIEESAEVSHEA